KEYTCIHASLLNDHLPRALDLFEDILFHSTFPEAEIEKEKGIILDEIASYEDSPEDAIADDFEDLVFSGHELGHNILGKAESLTALQQSHFVDFVKKYYQPENMVLGITADFPLKKIQKLCERYFGELENHSCPRPRTPLSKPDSRRVE